MNNGTQTDPVQALLAQTALQRTLFDATSRYYGIGTDTLNLPQGKTIIYLQRRFVPPPEHFQVLQEHTVVQGDRLDNLASTFFNDPQQYWRICDANNAMRPAVLTQTIGRLLRLTLPQGLSGGAGGG